MADLHVSIVLILQIVAATVNMSAKKEEIETGTVFKGLRFIIINLTVLLTSNKLLNLPFL